MGRFYFASDSSPHRQVIYPYFAMPEQIYGELPYLPGTLLYPPSPQLTLENSLKPAGFWFGGGDVFPYIQAWEVFDVTDDHHPGASWSVWWQFERLWFPQDMSEPRINLTLTCQTLSFPQPFPQRVWTNSWLLSSTPTPANSWAVFDGVTSTAGYLRPLPIL
jgi:hypothetical protein